MTGCFIKGLENPNLNGILVGFQSDKDGNWSASENWPPCCNGTGNMLCNNDVFRCDLKQRLKRVETLFDHLEMQTGQQSLPILAKWSQNHEFFINWLTLKRTIGYYFSQRNELRKPGILWAYAFIAAFRFNIQTLVFRIEKRNFKFIEKHLQTELEPNAIIFIEQVDHPIVPESSLYLEQVISWAYNANLKMWLEFPSKAPKLNIRQIGKAEFLGRLQQRLTKHTNQKLDNWLDPPSISKMKSMCQELQTRGG